MGLSPSIGNVIGQKMQGVRFILERPDIQTLLPARFLISSSINFSINSFYLLEVIRQNFFRSASLYRNQKKSEVVKNATYLI